MDSYIITIIIFFTLAIAGCHATLPSEVYWKTTFGGTVMPKSLQGSFGHNAQIGGSHGGSFGHNAQIGGSYGGSFGHNGQISGSYGGDASMSSSHSADLSASGNSQSESESSSSMTDASKSSSSQSSSSMGKGNNQPQSSSSASGANGSQSQSHSSNSMTNEGNTQSQSSSSGADVGKKQSESSSSSTSAGNNQSHCSSSEGKTGNDQSQSSSSPKAGDKSQSEASSSTNGSAGNQSQSSSSNNKDQTHSSSSGASDNQTQSSSSSSATGNKNNDQSKSSSSSTAAGNIHSQSSTSSENATSSQSQSSSSSSKTSKDDTQSSSGNENGSQGQSQTSSSSKDAGNNQSQSSSSSTSKSEEQSKSSSSSSSRNGDTKSQSSSSGDASMGNSGSDDSPIPLPPNFSQDMGGTAKGQFSFQGQGPAQFSFNSIPLGLPRSAIEIVAQCINGHSQFVNHQVDDSISSLFFKDTDLHVGAKMSVHFTKSINTATFMPLKIAESILTNKIRLLEVLRNFHLNLHSEVSNRMMETINVCQGSKHIEGMGCLASLEAIVDYAVQVLGKKVRPVSVKVDTKGKMEYNVISARKLQYNTTVACNKLIFPCAIFFCQHMPKADMHLVTLSCAATGIQVKVPVLCYHDTSKWNPDHWIFRHLGVKPGACPICHYLGADDMAWVPQ
ncbi:hypothetical protein Ancab_002238 [Ancistrocladus abbreviatus]